jgi:S1-C subfamily serine protease
VVLIKAIRPLFEEEFTVAGTGMIHDESGLVLTAAHVVDGASIIKVQVPGLGHTVSARLEGINPCQDLAIVRMLEGGPFVPATFGSSASVRPGDEVRVIAFPGDADSLDDLSVSRGIVNRLGAEGVVITGLTYPDLIGTDAIVEPGNSGGPLIAWEGPDTGKVIGVVLLRGGEEREIGYAVPVEKKRDTIGQLVDGHREYWLGTLMIPLEFLAMLVPDLELTWDVSGMLVFGVYPDSPADEVGMQSGDVLLEMKGIDAASMDEVCGVLASSPSGDPISVVVWREGTILEGQLFSDSVLEPSPARQPATAPVCRPAPAQPPQVELDFNARGYEQWGRPVGQPNPCSLFDNSSGVRKFNMDITVTNNSQELITHWFPGFYANTGRELLTCWYAYGDMFPSVPAGGSVVVTFAVFAEPNEYVSDVRLLLLGSEYRRCYSTEGALVDCS